MPFSPTGQWACGALKGCSGGRYKIPSLSLSLYETHGRSFDEGEEWCKPLDISSRNWVRGDVQNLKCLW